MTVTSKDIAKELGVSQSTVSRALRRDPRVAASTMQRVLKAAERRNYTPNLAARSLITRRARTVGVVVSDITNPFYPELLDILHNEFALANYRTILLNERTDARPEQQFAELINGGAVDGLVYVSAVLGLPLPGQQSSARPIVLLNREISSSTTDSVVSDNESGGRAVADAILGHGHRRIALIAGRKTPRRAGIVNAVSRSSCAHLVLRSILACGGSVSTAMRAVISGASIFSRSILGPPPCSLRMT